MDLIGFYLIYWVDWIGIIGLFGLLGLVFVLNDLNIFCLIVLWIAMKSCLLLFQILDIIRGRRAFALILLGCLPD